jgi:hypothetical protein
MAFYLIFAKPNMSSIKELYDRILKNEIAQIKPFGRAMNHSLRLARIIDEETIAWEEEDYCSPPLAQEREFVLDKYFEILKIEKVKEGEGWNRIASKFPFWLAYIGLQKREGERPITRPTTPHQQLNQNPPLEIYKMLYNLIFSLPYITESESLVSVPGARAAWINDEAKNARRELMWGRVEFAHIHPPYDGSLHLVLPKEWEDEILNKGWGEPHPVYKMKLIDMPVYMIYAPRNVDEVYTVFNIFLISYSYILGERIWKPAELLTQTTLSDP